MYVNTLIARVLKVSLVPFQGDPGTPGAQGRPGTPGHVVSSPAVYTMVIFLHFSVLPLNDVCVCVFACIHQGSTGPAGPPGPPGPSGVVRELT